METKQKLYQEFQGKKYWLQKGEKYFKSHRYYLHRVIWEHYNGLIPKGYHIHHKDGNSHNNEIDNLNLINGSLHIRLENKKRLDKNPDYYKKFQQAGIEKAKEWHKSKDGIEWHKRKAKEQGFGKPDLPIKKCEECGKEFKPKSYHNRFCHANCKMRARTKRIRLEKEK